MQLTQLKPSAINKHRKHERVCAEMGLEILVCAMALTKQTRVPIIEATHAVSTKDSTAQQTHDHKMMHRVVCVQTSKRTLYKACTAYDGGC